MNEQEYHYPGYVKTDDIVSYCEEMARDYELTNPSYSDACSDIGNKCLDLSNKNITEVKHGKWVEKSYGGYNWNFMCSECGFLDGFPMKERLNFCPNCGADMKGETNG